MHSPPPGVYTLCVAALRLRGGAYGCGWRSWDRQSLESKGKVNQCLDMINPMLFIRIRTREACMRRNLDWVGGGGAVVLTGTQTLVTGR